MLARELQREVFIGEAWRPVLDFGLFIWLRLWAARIGGGGVCLDQVCIEPPVGIAVGRL